jgi:acid phosphatase class B
MNTAVLDKQTSNKVAFISFIVPEFARSYKMTAPESYKYLKKYGAWDYLNEHWWALYTDNPFWTVRHLYDMCYENGGQR